MGNGNERHRSWVFKSPTARERRATEKLLKRQEKEKERILAIQKMKEEKEKAEAEERKRQEEEYERDKAAYEASQKEPPKRNIIKEEYESRMTPAPKLISKMVEETKKPPKKKKKKKKEPSLIELLRTKE